MIMNVKMADGPVVLSNVLCFLKKKFGKHAVKTLKMSLNDFYTAEDLSIAKNQLIEDTDSMKLSMRCDMTVQLVTTKILQRSHSNRLLHVGRRGNQRARHRTSQL